MIDDVRSGRTAEESTPETIAKSHYVLLSNHKIRLNDVRLWKSQKNVWEIYCINICIWRSLKQNGCRISWSKTRTSLHFSGMFRYDESQKDKTLLHHYMVNLPLIHKDHNNNHSGWELWKADQKDQKPYQPLLKVWILYFGIIME